MIPDLLCYADKVTPALAKMVHWPNTTTPSKRSVSMESGHTQEPSQRLESNPIQVVILPPVSSQRYGKYGAGIRDAVLDQ